MTSPNNTTHRDSSGEYSELLPCQGKVDISQKDALEQNTVFDLFKHTKDIKESLNVSNLEYCSEGSYGQVYRCMDRQNNERRYAIKILSAIKVGPCYMECWTKEAENEVKLLQCFDDPNIIKYVGHCWLDSDKIARSYLAIKTELMDITLDNHLEALKGPMDYPEVKKFFNQICSGLEYMHDMGVAHRDIKGGNIMINKNKDWKILDFGMSHRYEGPIEQALESHFFRGTLLYKCPCKRNKEPYNPFSSDPYSFGMVLWQCILGIENVFWHNNDPEYAKEMQPAWTIIEETVWPKLEEDGEIGPHHLVAWRLVAPLEERVSFTEALELFEEQDRVCFNMF